MLLENVSGTTDQRSRQQQRRTPDMAEISEIGDAVQADTSVMIGSQITIAVEPQSEQITTDTSQSTQGLLPLAISQPPLYSYAAAEADFTVQELGLISMREPNISRAEQAAAASKSPEEMEGRAEEQYKELVERESKLRTLLDDMHGNE